MTALETLILIGGILHLGTLIGSAQVPRELNFRNELPRLAPLLRQWILVAGGYVVLDLIAFGLISLYAQENWHREILFSPELSVPSLQFSGFAGC